MKIVIALANGFETLEALTPFDLFYRCGLDVSLASITGSKTVISAHNLKVETDILLDDIDIKNIDVFVIPGGMPGAKNLQECKKVVEIAKYIIKDENKVLASICASPAYVLGYHHIADDREMTCYPSCDKVASHRNFSSENVVIDGNLITARGAGCALDWTYKIIERIINKDKAGNVRTSIIGD